MNEIKRQLKMKIGDTTQQQRNVVHKIQLQNPIYSKKSKPLFPAIVSIAVFAATLIFVFSMISKESKHTTSANLPESITMIDPSNGEVIELDYQEYSAFLNYILENNYGKQEDVLSTLKYKPIKNEFSSSYLVTFDCGKAVCASAYLTLDSQTSTMAPLGEGILTSKLIYSPNQENVMFLLSNSESRIPTLYHEYFSYYNWPITNIEWITNKKISVTVADIDDNTKELIEQWTQGTEKSTKGFEITLP